MQQNPHNNPTFHQSGISKSKWEHCYKLKPIANTPVFFFLSSNSELATAYVTQQVGREEQLLIVFKCNSVYHSATPWSVEEFVFHCLALSILLCIHRRGYFLIADSDNHNTVQEIDPCKLGCRNKMIKE